MNERIQREHGDESPPEVVWQRFRPNIFFETDQPLEEDRWKFVKINETEFQFLGEFPFFGLFNFVKMAELKLIERIRFTAECGRCKMTTFNKETCNYEQEPLRTLKVCPIERARKAGN